MRFITTSYDILYRVSSTNLALSCVAILIRKEQMNKTMNYEWISDIVAFVRIKFMLFVISIIESNNGESLELRDSG